VINSGSAFAGVKAGILGGIFYSGSIGIFNYSFLNFYKSTMLQTISERGCSGSVPGSAIPTPEECFTSFTVVYLPLTVILTFAFSLILASFYGRFFESIPGTRYWVKAIMVSLPAFFILLLLNSASNTLSVLFELVVTIFYSKILAFLYKRYTGVVKFPNNGAESLRMILDNKDVTGRSTTLAIGSLHNIRALANQYSAFKEWSFAGNILIEDTKSFDTTMRVSGNGVLRAISGQYKR
jgi:hypothetical protein